MTLRALLTTCAECGERTDEHSLICNRCQPLYRDEPHIDDACTCISCRSDMAGLVPCVGEKSHD